MEQLLIAPLVLIALAIAALPLLTLSLGDLRHGGTGRATRRRPEPTRSTTVPIWVQWVGSARAEAEDREPRR